MESMAAAAHPPLIYTLQNMHSQGVWHLSGPGDWCNYSFVKNDHPLLAMMGLVPGSMHDYSTAPIKDRDMRIENDIPWVKVPKQSFDTALDAMFRLATVLKENPS